MQTINFRVFKRLRSSTPAASTIFSNNLQPAPREPYNCAKSRPEIWESEVSRAVFLDSGANALDEWVGLRVLEKARRFTGRT